MHDIKLKGVEGEKAFKNLEKNREKIIRKSSSKPINTNYPANILAKKLHPEEQFVQVEQIIEENENVKTFVLVPDKSRGTEKLAPFKAGQYVSICVEIDGGVYRRPITISCSPKHALNGRYSITIERVQEEIVSNFFLDEVKEGFSFSVSGPVGDFCYSSIRDAKNVIALAQGSGIIPFISMAEAIYDGILDCNLTILYEVETREDLLFKERFDDICCKFENVQIVYVLSKEDDNEYFKGFINKELVMHYMQEENSFFVSGSTSFYSSMNALLKDLNVAKKYVRHDLFMGKVDLKNNNTFSLTVLCDTGKFHITCKGKETLLQAMEKAGIVAPSRCHVGVCGFCRSKLISGKVKTIDENVRASDKTYNYIHPCATYPESDVVLKLPN